MTKPVDIIDTATPAVTKAISALAPAVVDDGVNAEGLGEDHVVGRCGAVVRW